MAHRRLLGRQASATIMAPATQSQLEQPTMTIALSTTFTPPASCSDNSLTILPPPGYYIWANEPVPFPNTTVTDCYPSEFLQSYTSTTSGAFGSSVVPVMSPLVCPQNFCVQTVSNNYIACCPSGYKFTPPDIVSVESRPAYGGTCYSPFAVGVTSTAVAYDEEGSTGLQPWAAEASGQNAYAHPIDGFAENPPTSVGCIAPTSSSVSSSQSSSTDQSSSAAPPSDTPAPAQQSNRISSGTIAGASVGAVVGLAAIVGLIFFLLRRRRRQSPSSAPAIHQIDDTTGARIEKDGAITAAETDAGVAAAELGGRSDKYAHNASAMNNGQGAWELNAGVAHELPAEPKSNPGPDHK